MALTYLYGQTDTRFMVDFATFNKMHPEKFPTSSRLRDDLGKNVTASEAPPDGSFILLLPANVRGFNMQEKKWGSYIDPIFLFTC